MYNGTIPSAVAACGLYCGACRSYKNGKCPGCRDNEKASWCKIRTCCIEKDYVSCAQCVEFADTRKCGKINNLPGKVMGFLFNSDRFACIERIREKGIAEYAAEMDAQGWQTIKRKK